MIREGTPVVEASSGSTAVSEAYFAQMIGVPFYAVMPRTTSAEKIAAITHYGGNCHLIDDGRALYAEAAALAARLGGHYMDQFTFAERATDWRGNNNIAESIFTQLQGERRPGAGLDRDGRRDRRHLGDHRPLFALPPISRRGSASPMSSIRPSSIASASRTARMSASGPR